MKDDMQLDWNKNVRRLLQTQSDSK